MNESIGAKGVGRDFRRTLIINKQEKAKLKEYCEKEKLKQLEKEVKKKQIYTIVKTLPIAITYETIKAVLPKKEEVKEESFIEEEKEIKENKQEEKPDYIEVIIVLKDGTTKKIKVPKVKENEIKKEEEKRPQEEILEEIKEESKKGIEEKQEEEVLNKKTKEEEKKEKEEVQETKKEEIPQKQEQVTEELNSSSKKIDEFQDLTEKQQEKLDKLKSRKIIDVYEKQLKEIRYELRNLIFEYNVLVGESKEIVESKEAEKLLDRLNVIISKIEQLKTKINIENLDKYDDNYIYTLIEDYMEEFKDKKVISEIKDSKLYILISDKLAELDKEKEKLQKDVEERKDELEEKEESFDKLKESYYNIDKINKDLKDFYNQQEIILSEVRQKIDQATTVRERTEVQIMAMNRETRRMLRRLTLAMMFPGIRGALPIAATAALYADFMRNIINPQTVTRRYKVITVKDYSKSIESNLKQIDKAASLLNKTEKEIDRMISDIKSDFSEYIGVIRECDELLSNLEKIKSELHEKDYEIKKIKAKQEEELERNNAKVLTIGEYEM